MRKFLGVVAIVLSALVAPASAIDLSKVVFVDDFLGIAFDSRWHHSLAGTGATNLEPYVGGWARLYTGNAAGVSRLRLGEEPGNSPYNVPNWCACKNAVAEAIVLINTVAGATVTIGFTGLNDPENVGGALLFNAQAMPDWRLQVATGGQSTNIATGFTHTAGVPFRVRIEMSPTEVRAYINGNLVAATSLYIQQTGQTFELQLWNIVPFSAAMWVDAVAIEQDR